MDSLKLYHEYINMLNENFDVNINPRINIFFKRIIGNIMNEHYKKVDPNYVEQYDFLIDALDSLITIKTYKDKIKFVFDINSDIGICSKLVDLIMIDINYLNKKYINKRYYYNEIKIIFTNNEK